MKARRMSGAAVRRLEMHDCSRRSSHDRTFPELLRCEGGGTQWGVSRRHTKVAGTVEFNIRCVLSKWDYFVKKENLILGLKIKTRTNKEEQKLI